MRLSLSKVFHSRKLWLTKKENLLAHDILHHISFSSRKKIQFALFPFHSLLLRESLLFSFPAGTKMFQFPACAFLSKFPKRNLTEFRNSWFKGCMHLAKTYRSLPRPSSQLKPNYPSSSLIAWCFPIVFHWIWLLTNISCLMASRFALHILNLHPLHTYNELHFFNYKNLIKSRLVGMDSTGFEPVTSAYPVFCFIFFCFYFFLCISALLKKVNAGAAL